MVRSFRVELLSASKLKYIIQCNLFYVAGNKGDQSGSGSVWKENSLADLPGE